MRVAHHGRSTEAEIRNILLAAFRHSERIWLSSLFTAIGCDAELSDSDVEPLQKCRDADLSSPLGYK